MSFLRKRSRPPEGKKRYSVGGVITISVHTEVVASCPEEARKIALNERGIMSLCHQCASGNPEREWVTSGELDGGEPVPHEGDELEVVEL